MEKNESYYIGGLKLILFQLQYINPNTPPNWDSESISYFKKTYSKEKLIQINDGINWYLLNDDLDITNLIPDINYSSEEILKFLKYVHLGFSTTNLV